MTYCNTCNEDQIFINRRFVYEWEDEYNHCTTYEKECPKCGHMFYEDVVLRKFDSNITEKIK